VSTSPPPDSAGTPAAGPPAGPGATKHRLLSRGTWPEARFIGEVLRTETVGGGILLFAAVVAILWANSPWGDAYQALGATTIGPEALHLDLDLAHWAADGLLAIFFFVVGLELKREFIAGDLRNPQRAALPIIAAIGGMTMPALIYVSFTLSTGGDALRGWAIPTATDIAFALAVLAVIGSHLPGALRAFLLTLAVVDDLLAITIIAFFYTDDFHAQPLLLALLPIVAFALLVQRRKTWWWALLPLAFTAWALVHASGVHATIAGVLLGFTVPVVERGQRHGLAEHLEHKWRPISAGLAVPIFAFFAAGVSLRGGGLGEVLRDPVAIGVMAGLVLGKVTGVLGSTFLLARFTRAELDENLAWGDVLGVSLLAGIGFTVSLLIGELAFGAGSDRDEHVKAAVLLGSLLSAVLAAIVLSRRNAAYRRIRAEETIDADASGIPDVYERGHQGA
jgi:Na+:H+ antiporter, NhaA family